MALYSNLFVIQYHPIGNILYDMSYYIFTSYILQVLSILRALAFNDVVLDKFKINIFSKGYYL